MWTRSELKNNAKDTFLPLYWKSVFAAIIHGIFTYSAFTNRHQGPEGESVFEMISSWQIGALFASILTFSLAIGILLTIFIKNPIRIGYARFLLDSTEKEPKDVSLRTLLDFFFDGKYTKILVAIFTTDLIEGLFYLQLIVPGIIKSYQYRFVPYLLAEDYTLTGKEARAKSKELMQGQKWNAFVLDLSFLGWALLSAITAGVVGIFWTRPYFQMTNCYLYKAIKEGN